MDSFTEFEAQLLVACYLVSEDSSEPLIRIGTAIEQFGLSYRPGWVHRAVEGYIRSGFSNDARTIADELDQDVWLTAAGYREAERLRGRIKLSVVPKRPLASAPTPPANVPASDRIVRLDDNDPRTMEVRQSTADLEKQLRESNDLGALSAEEAQVATYELGQLRETLGQPSVRLSSIKNLAVNTLSWIGQQAASALVGTAALALLGLIAALFGFSI